MEIPSRVATDALNIYMWQDLDFMNRNNANDFTFTVQNRYVTISCLHFIYCNSGLLVDPCSINNFTIVVFVDHVTLAS